MFSLACNLNKNDFEFLPLEISLKKKCAQTTWIFRPSKLHRKKYVEKTWKFRPVKLRQEKYVEMT